MVVARSVMLALAMSTWPLAIASAENVELQQAREAIADVRYDAAQALLVHALLAGDSSPGDLVEIYRLSASTAIVLGQSDVAEQYYRRWLALVPDATLPDTVAPKLRQPFVAAQAYMAAHGRLSVKARRQGAVVDVVVESDPLSMVHAIALAGDKKRLGADRSARFERSDDQPGPVHVLDEHGNRLVIIDDGDIERVATLPERPVSGQSDDVGVPLYRRPIAWAIGAGAFGLVGVAFGLAASSAHDDVVRISANPGEHFASELDDARARRDRHVFVANIGFAAAGACAVTGVVMWLVQPSRRATASPTSATVMPLRGGAAVVMSRSF